MDILNAVMKINAGLCDVLENPLISPDKKIALIGQISAEGSFNQLTTNFLNLLVDKGRIDCITEVIGAFETRYCQAMDIQVAIVKSAVALEEQQNFLIAKKVRELTKSKSVKIKPVLDEALIGGFLVEYGSSQIDVSIRGSFERVRKELHSVSV
jgi:F-type H+-transporting ATPase subunit delta